MHVQHDNPASFDSSPQEATQAPPEELHLASVRSTRASRFGAVLSVR